MHACKTTGISFGNSTTSISQRTSSRESAVRRSLQSLSSGIIVVLDWGKGGGSSARLDPWPDLRATHTLDATIHIMHLAARLNYTPPELDSLRGGEGGSLMSAI